MKLLWHSVKPNIVKSCLPPVCWCWHETRNSCWGCGGHWCQSDDFVVSSRGYQLRTGKINKEKVNQENPRTVLRPLQDLQKPSCCSNIIFLWNWEGLRLISKAENPNRVAKRNVPVKKGPEGVVAVQVFKVTVRVHELNKRTHSPATELWYLYLTAFLIIISYWSLKLNLKA